MRGVATKPGIGSSGGNRAGGSSGWTGWLFLLTLLALYVPVIAASAALWFTDDNYAHGVFIIPACIWLLWLQRESIRKAVRKPTAWGLLPLALGLMFQTLGYGLNSKALAMISLIPALAGAVLILYGPELFRICSFPIGFLIFIARWPGIFTDSLSQCIQRVSAVG
ncbi:MAG: exosortase/archaeosortase family protein, partial [Armatimonadota bacterium]|nr:exosortase/archaeosortase family protein [Armatimonadota bacterium]